MLRQLLTAALLFGATACATATPQTDALLASARDLPDTDVIPGVPFIAQSANECGPATLAMAMGWSGRAVSSEELAAEAFSAAKRGSLQTELIAASRRHGMLAVPIAGLAALLGELAAGHPVIIFENLALSWYPRWHYALAVGYDLNRRQIILHDGAEAYRRWDLRKFERSWEYSRHWGLVVLPPSELAVSGSELANSEAAAGLESAGKLGEAATAYRRILRRWPDSLPALIGLGNVAYARHEYGESIEILRWAARAHPQSSVARQNLATALATRGH